MKAKKSQVTADLTDRAMLVDVTITLWTSRAFDQKASQQVADANKVGVRMGNYNKNVLPINTNGDYAPSYKAVTRLGGAIREAHYRQSLPWSDSGSRILPAANYDAYMAEVRLRRAEYEAAAKTFCAEYPQIKKAAKGFLNGLYNEANYPTTYDMISRFGVTIHVQPIVTSDDFRVGLASDEIAGIKKQMEADIRGGLETAMGQLWHRLYEPVAHMAEKLADKDAIFRDSLVGNVQEIVDLLPNLNLTNDSKLASMAKQVERRLLATDVDDLRKDETTRSTVAQQAAEIERQMAGILGL